MITSLQLDEKEIRQLILNMSINGLEAMSPGGAFTISTYEEGNEMILKIEDQGSGIKEEYLEKLGTPFSRRKKQARVLAWPYVTALPPVIMQ